jgi:hypothetical protein
MTDLDADQALERCREAGFAEGVWIHDVRAGDCQITTLDASVVILACEDGQPAALDGAAELLASYRNGGIRLSGDEP